MKGNAVSQNMMLCIPRRRWTCWNQLTLAFKTFTKRGFCERSSGDQCAAKSENERATGIHWFLFTLIVQNALLPSYFGELLEAGQPQFMISEHIQLLNRFMNVP